MFTLTSVITTEVPSSVMFAAMTLITEQILDFLQMSTNYQ